MHAGWTRRITTGGATLLIAVSVAAGAADAQPLGSFRWQLQPYCNVITVVITQNGSVFRLEGLDDRCGAGGAAASVIGTAFLNANGSVGFGLNIVDPGGAPLQVDATASLATLGGTWRDSAGRSGAFIFTSGAGTSGGARPAVGPIGAAKVDATQVQLRVSGACPSGEYMQSVGQTGTVTCAPVAGSGGGDITAVSAGPGLAGGGASGAVTLGLATTPAGAFDLQSNNGLVAAGVVGSGAVVPAGPGARMVWNPRKAAFRAGVAQSNEWDNNNVGNYSVAFGIGARASGHASMAVGDYSAATGDYSVALGGGAAVADQSTAIGRGTIANSVGATAIGAGITAEGPYSMVFGQGVRTTTAALGSFMFGDGAASSTVSSLPNQFLVRASGGVVFWSSADTSFPSGPGVALYSGTGGWSNLSDVNLKEHFRDLAGEDVLARIAAMPVREWSYKSQPAAIRHVGPTAQDFHAAFGLGEDEHRINSIDADGIALAAVRALETRTRDLDARNQDLARENEALRARLDRLEQRVSGQSPTPSEARRHRE